VKYPFFIIIYLYDVTMQSSQLIDVIKIIFKPFFMVTPELNEIQTEGE